VLCCSYLNENSPAMTNWSRGRELMNTLKLVCDLRRGNKADCI
jgi:hypothetical protein